MPNDTNVLNLNPHATIMSFDFGEKRIGVAIGNMTIGVANALTTIHAESNADRLTAVSLLVRDWQPAQFVIGEPAHLNGEPHPIAHLAKKFGNRLKENFKLPVAYVNEYLSSTEAAVLLAEKGIKGRNQKAKIDAVAAQVILQSWLDDQKKVIHAA
ncbi:MAG: Holliday junction resolvase RuvX [Pseudomonadota bacterium]